MDILRKHNVEIPGITERTFDDARSYITYSKFLYDMVNRDPKLDNVAYLMLRRYIEVETKFIPTFSACVEYLAGPEVNASLKKPFLHPIFVQSVKQFSKELDAIVDGPTRVSLSYIGLYQFITKYMLILNNKFVETPEYTMMRVAISYCPNLKLTRDGLEFVESLYQALCANYISAPSPTLFNAGRFNMQCVSCFVVTLREDSMDGIFKTIGDCAKISKNGGGIGFNLSKLRAAGSLINGSGAGKGIPPVAHIFGSTSQYADQKGKRPGSFALWLEPWHADFPAFLELKKLGGDDMQRARALFLGIWMNDEFMHRLRREREGDQTQIWSFFCPDQCPGMDDVHSEDFSTLYCMYESRGLARATMKPTELWKRIIASVCETGAYMMFKDAVNRKSNEQNLGTIKCSNLCTEIVEFTGPDHTSVCVLSSFPLTEFVSEGHFNFNKLADIVMLQVRSLDNLIDSNYYPTKRAMEGAMKTRPLGLGIQGLAETFAMLGYAWGDPRAIQLQRDIFETMYLFANTASAHLAAERGCYPAYKGSPASNGVFQPDMWGVDAENESTLWKHQWKIMKDLVKKHGLRNSQFVAPMPTASTAIIRGLTASFEPFTEFASVRKLDAGDFWVTNGPLTKWVLDNCPEDAEKILLQVTQTNSVQGIPQLKPIAHIYRTAFEIDQKTQMAHIECMLPFIDQSLSHNLFIPRHSPEGHHFQAVVAGLLYTSWSRGWKHGTYYTHIEKESHAPSYKSDSGNLTASASASDQDSPQICRMEPGCTSCES